MVLLPMVDGSLINLRPGFQYRLGIRGRASRMRGLDGARYARGRHMKIEVEVHQGIRYSFRMM